MTPVSPAACLRSERELRYRRWQHLVGAGSRSSQPIHDRVGHIRLRFQHPPGANVPSGNLVFQFKAGNLTFKSTSMNWLVVTGSRGRCSKARARLMERIPANSKWTPGTIPFQTEAFRMSTLLGLRSIPAPRVVTPATTATASMRRRVVGRQQQPLSSCACVVVELEARGSLRAVQYERYNKAYEQPAL